MTDTTKPRKTKRILSNIDFSADNSHIALTSKDNGPANGQPAALVLKSNNFSQEYITKIQQIQVTLSLPEFLERFFNLYGSQAEVLARLMGYVPDAEEQGEEWSWESYIQEQVDSFVIMKSAHDSKNLADVLSKLTQEQYLGLVTDQAMLEKALKKSEELAKATQNDTSKIMHEVNDGVSAPEVKLTKSKAEKPEVKGKQMTKPVEAQAAPEMVEKSKLTALEKAVQDGQEALTKAMATIAEFETKQKEQIIKSKTAQFAAVIKDEKILAPVVKAALALDDDVAFQELLTAVSEMAASVETSKSAIEKTSLFTETGASISEEQPVKESAVARILKANQSK